MKFDPFLPPWVLLCLVLVLSILSWRSHVSLRDELGPAFSRFLSAWRCFILLLFVFLLLNPFKENWRADTSRLEIAVLQDSSLSMLGEDCDQMSRLDKALQLRAEHSWFAALDERGQVQDYLFDKDLRYHFGTVKGGQSAPQTWLSKALAEVKERSGETLGAVVLLSDGGDNGTPVVEDWLQAEDGGVPVHVVAFGESVPQADFSLEFVSPPSQVERNRHFKLKLRVKRNEHAPLEAKVGIETAERSLKIFTVQFLPGQLQKEVEFEHREFVAGSRFYRAHVAPAPGELALYDNVDYAALRVSGVRQVRVFAMLGQVNPELAFIRRLAARENSFFTVDAAVRTAGNNWIEMREDKESYHRSFTLPDLDEYDVLVVDALAVSFSEEEKRSLRRFLAGRGGGVLWLGAASVKGLPELRGVESSLHSPLRKSVAKLGPRSFLWKYLPGGNEDSLDAIFPLLEGEPLLVANLEEGLARTVELSVEGKALMFSSPAGLGRLVWSSVPGWEWALADDGYEKLLQEMYARVFHWLASGTLSRIKLIDYRGEYPAAQPVKLSWNALDESYRVNPAMEVSAQWKSGREGSWKEVELDLSMSHSGAYSLSWTPPQAGEYYLRLRCGSGDALFEKQLLLLASAPVGEVVGESLKESVLRKVAELSGGSYRHWRELSSSPSSLALSDNVPLKESRVYFLDNSFWGLLLLSLLFAEWYLRRRYGTP